MKIILKTKDGEEFLITSISDDNIDQNKMLQNLIGIGNPTDNDIPNETKTTVTTSSPFVKENKEKYSPTSFYITDRHRKALKMKTALSDKPEDKDLSSIARTALDIYLADILKDL